MKLYFEGISAAYRNKNVLKGLSFTVDTGSITALTGRNGAGKSTLISCLNGEKRDYRGRILLDGRDVRGMDRRELAVKIACLPQVLPRPHVTVRELVSFGRAPHTPLTGKLSVEDKEKIAWAMDAAGIADMQDAFVDNLSGGERKKAFFAMTIAQDTPIVVLDEPTAHLDAVSRFELLDLIETMRRKTGKTFLIVMHDLPDVLRCADRIVTICDGGVVFDGDAEQCLAAKIPQRCFGIQVRGSRDAGFAVTPLK